MKTIITFEDKGNSSVLMLSDIIVSEKDRANNELTPAAILALATKSMFTNGMLARAGQIGLEGISEGKAPEECILAAFKENKNNDTNT